MLDPTFKLTPAKVSSDRAVNPELGLGTNIVNLADIDLNNHEKAILARGLKFIPTPVVVSKEPLLASFHDFSRKVKLSCFFHGKTDRGHINKKLFCEKSSWEPHCKFLPPEILDELDKLKAKLGKMNVISDIPNISNEEFLALEDLQKQKNLVFKKADKGNAIVIMELDYYIQEALRQLNNENFYTRIDEPIYPATFDQVTDILQDLRNKGFLTPAQVKYLTPERDCSSRVFYMLPKIHKSMDKWTVPNRMPPGRPIVSDCGSDSYRWSELIDHYLKPLACTHPSYVKDTGDFIEKLRKVEISDNALLVTFDVESLYTNIQPDRGLEALDKVYAKSDSCMPYQHIRDLLEISLKNNDFQFNNQWYLQISGTAMGKKYAPNYANIFMANFEQEVMDKAKLKPTVYFRFLDDAFMIWEHSLEELHQFLDLFNTHDNSIKITREISEKSVDFLDVTVFKGNRFKNHNILDTKVYFKPTDTHQLLDRHSFHPRHTFDGILKSQLIRFLRICNNLEDFHDACSKLFKALREQRHYSARQLRTVKSRFLQNYRQLGEYEDPVGASLKCNRKRCQCCLRMEETSYFYADDGDYPIFGRIDCQSKNIIYVIECQKCNMKYVGETQRSLAARLTGHISDINTYKSKPVAEHFNEFCYPDTENLKIYPIEFIPEQGSVHKNKMLRLQREAFWIRKLNTQTPSGMNLKLPEKRDIRVSLPFNKTSIAALKLFRETYSSIKEKFPVKFKGQLCCAYKRNENLADFLVRSKLK